MTPISSGSFNNFMGLSFMFFRGGGSKHVDRPMPSDCQHLGGGGGAQA